MGLDSQAVQTIILSGFINFDYIYKKKDKNA
jgi:hypothetical protein